MNMMQPDLLLEAPETLMGKRLASMAMARNHIGEVAAMFACRALNAAPLPITNAKVCPDFKAGTLFGEIKSVGKNGRALIYAFRLDKEEHFAQAHHYLYVFVSHGCRITCQNISEIVDYFTDFPPVLICCTLMDVKEAVAGTPIRKFSLFEAPEGMSAGEIARIGYNRKGYKEGGWQFAINKIPVENAAPAVTTWNNTTLNVQLRETARWKAARS